MLFRKSNFAKVNTDALFKAVDVDNSGTITEDEWKEFWNSVKRSGYSEEEIEEEVNQKAEEKEREMFGLKSLAYLRKRYVSFAIEN